MNILNDIQAHIDNDEMPVSRQWLEQAQREYPYFTLPALLYLKQHGTDDEALLGRLAISSPDRKVLASMLGESSALFRNFYPEEAAEPERASTTGTIDRFLDAFGSSNGKEAEVIESLIFNPQPDYADILAAQEKEERGGAPLTSDDLSEEDALINSFVEQEFEKARAITPTPTQHIEDDEKAEIADAPIAQPTEHDNSMLSESLAKMYISQHKYSKALEIIENINLNFPEKSIYFADQIRFLRKLVLNEKTKK